jgi:oxaloacetate decarboxylase alpha subunit
VSRLELVDVSIRDGNQCLWGAVALNTAQVLRIAPLLDRVGFRALDFTSSTHMGIAVRNHRENPWERIRLVHDEMPNTPLQFIGTGLRFISWEMAQPDFMQLVYERLVSNGIERFALMDPMNDAAALLQSAAMVGRGGGRGGSHRRPHVHAERSTHGRILCDARRHARPLAPR